MKTLRWAGLALALVALLVTLAIRVAEVAKSDPDAAIRDAGIGAGVFLILGALVAAFVWARTAERVRRRRQLGQQWVDDVTMSPADRLRALPEGVQMPRDLALVIDRGSLSLWASAELEPLLSMSGGSIRSIEVIDVLGPDGREFSVALETDTGPLSLAPSSVLGFPPRRADATAIADRISELAT